MMEVDFFFCGNSLLVVGDGDFSFSLALSRYTQFQAHNTTTSSLETESSIKIHAQAVENMAVLRKIGVSVFMEVDARELHTHEIIGKNKYDRIIFNFPIADRHNIKKNRALLADFFASCRAVLSAQGNVMVTLCKGQGGTPADKPMRSWHNSWQIATMAANAGFLLTSVEPFDASLFPEYHNVGFRFQDKSFNTSGALIHIFERSDLIQDSDSAVWGTVTHDDNIYSSSNYVTTKMKRNLLIEPHNPAALLIHELETCLNNAFKPCIHVPSPMLLPGCRSLAYIVRENEMDGDRPTSTGNNCVDGEAKLDMEREKESQDIFERQTLIHGIENNGGEKYCRHDLSPHQFFLPIDNAAVYLLGKSSNEDVRQSADIECAQDELEKASLIENINKKAEEASYHPYLDASSAMSLQSSSIFHHRVSLLENLPAICNRLVISSQYMFNRESKLMDGTISESPKDFSLKNLPHEVDPSPQFLGFKPCVITSGQCMLPGPICKNFNPVKQELMVIHQILDLQDIRTELPTSCISVNYSNLTVLNNISANIISAFNSSSSLPQTCNLLMQPCDSLEIVLQGVDHCIVTNRILLQDFNDSDLQEPSLIGYTIFVCVGDHGFHVALINISNFACRFWGFEDERLLWCTEKKFLSQFQFDASSSVRIVKLPSLYPLTFAHDISFWERDGSVFNISDFYGIIRSIAGDLVIHVSLVDTYFDPITRCKSQCFRLHFQSCFQALTYQTSWKLQSRIRLEVAKTLGVTLR